MLFTFKKIAGFLSVVILIALAYASYIYFKPMENIASKITDIQLTDKELLDEFIANAKSADIKYTNKIVELSGTLKKTEVHDSVCNLIFDNGGNYIVIASCMLSQKKEVAALKETSNIKIKGIYSGYIINDETFMIPAEIKIDRCTLLK